MPTDIRQTIGGGSRRSRVASGDREGPETLGQRSPAAPGCLLPASFPAVCHRGATKSTRRYRAMALCSLERLDVGVLHNRREWVALPACALAAQRQPGPIVGLNVTHESCHDTAPLRDGDDLSL